MFWSRWHLAWLGVCFLAASAGAFLLLFWLIVEGPPRPYYSPFGLAAFLLTFYTLPVVAFYFTGIAVGLTVRRAWRAFVRPSRRRTTWLPRSLATAKR